MWAKLFDSPMIQHFCNFVVCLFGDYSRVRLKFAMNGLKYVELQRNGVFTCEVHAGAPTKGGNFRCQNSETDSITDKQRLCVRRMNANFESFTIRNKETDRAYYVFGPWMNGSSQLDSLQPYAQAEWNGAGLVCEQSTSYIELRP